MSTKSPRAILEKLEQVLHAWTTLAPDKQFGGFTKQQFEAFIAASKSARTLVKTLENQLNDALALREQSDEEALETLQWIKNGVLGDQDNGGPNSALYQSMGYVRTSDRKSGLHRGKSLEKKQD